MSEHFHFYEAMICVWDALQKVFLNLQPQKLNYENDINTYT